MINAVTGLVPFQNSMDNLVHNLGPNPSPTAIAGYTQTYALKVHEDLAMNHSTGQAKFLEEPSRSRSKELVYAIIRDFQVTNNLPLALLSAAYKLRAISKPYVPIDTSALVNSAYIATDTTHDAVASAAFSRSESIRVSELNRRKTGRRKP